MHIRGNQGAWLWTNRKCKRVPKVPWMLLFLLYALLLLLVLDKGLESIYLMELLLILLIGNLLDR